MKQLWQQLALTLTLSLTLGALPAEAAITYQSVTETVTEGARGGMKMVVDGQVDGAKVRVDFRESTNPIMGKGSYIVSDDGKTMFLVNPEEKTYSELDLDALAKLAGGIMNSLGGLVKMEISDSKMEKLADEDGGSLLGYPTRHVRTKSNYTMSVKVLMMKQQTRTEMQTDIWVTNALTDPGLAVWLRKEPPATGNAEFDKIMRNEMSRLEGFPLKMVMVSTATDTKKGETTTRTTKMEVTKLETGVAAPPAATFQVPKGYAEAPLLPAAGEGNPFEEMMRGGRGRG